MKLKNLMVRTILIVADQDACLICSTRIVKDTSSGKEKLAAVMFDEEKDDLLD